MRHESSGGYADYYLWHGLAAAAVGGLWAGGPRCTFTFLDRRVREGELRVAFR